MLRTSLNKIFGLCNGMYSAARLAANNNWGQNATSQAYSVS